MPIQCLKCVPALICLIVVVSWSSHSLCTVGDANAEERNLTRHEQRDFRDQKLATILDRKALCKQPGRYIGWPSIAEAPNGDLLVVFSGDRTAHVSPDGKTQMIRSRDGGKTWSEPATINDLSIDDRDARIIRTKQGTMLVSWFTGPPYHTDLQSELWDVDNEIRLSEASNGDLGYPASVQLKDGTIWTVYYEIDQPGEKPCLMGTHWRLKDPLEGRR